MKVVLYKCNQFSDLQEKLFYKSPPFSLGLLLLLWLDKDI